MAARTSSSRRVTKAVLQVENALLKSRADVMALTQASDLTELRMTQRRLREAQKANAQLLDDVQVLGTTYAILTDPKAWQVVQHARPRSFLRWLRFWNL